MSGHVDVITVGETMVSLVATDGSLATATSFVATHGGAESNVAVELARRGLRVAWVSRLGDDPAGARITSALGTLGVDLTWVRTDATRPTGLMLRDTSGGVRYWREGSAASRLDPNDLLDVPVGDAGAVFVTGITAMLGPSPQRCAMALLSRATGLRAVDVNLRVGLWGSPRARELILPLVASCDVLFGSEAELGRLAEGRGVDLARACATLGPNEVVVKAGPRGAAALDTDGRWTEWRGAPVPDVDPVGAGDAFAGAYLAARLHGGSVEDALAEGTAAGARVAGQIGDTGATTTRDGNQRGAFDQDPAHTSSRGRS